MSSSSASAGGIVRRVSSERRRFSRAAGWIRSRSGRISFRISPLVVSGLDESTRNSTPRSRQNASVSSRQSGSSGRTTPSSRRALIPFVVPARHEAVEDRLDLVARRVPRGAQPVVAWRVAEIAQRRLAEAARRRRAHDLGTEHLGAEAGVRVGLLAPEAVVDMERTAPVAELAQREDEAARVGAAGDEAEHVAAGLDQLVAADVGLDPLEQHPRPKSAASRYHVGVGEPRLEHRRGALELAPR